MLKEWDYPFDPKRYEPVKEIQYDENGKPIKEIKGFWGGTGGGIVDNLEDMDLFHLFKQEDDDVPNIEGDQEYNEVPRVGED